MIHKSLAVAAALALAGFAAHAEDYSVVENLTDGGAGVFGVTHFQGGDFTDTFAFTGTGDRGGIVSAGLITVGFTDSSNIDFSSVTMNGVALTLSPTGTIETATLSPTALKSPFVLTVMGTAAPDGASPVLASYAGSINVSAVPEPETYALMLAGMAAIGFIARRRRTD